MLNKHCTKWEPVPGAPGYVERWEQNVDAGVLHIRYVQRKIADISRPTTRVDLYAMEADEGEEWKQC